MNPDYINIGLPEDKLIEECAEVIQAIIKAKRFGMDTEIPGTRQLTNRINQEIEDLELAIKNYKGEKLNESNDV